MASTPLNVRVWGLALGAALVAAGCYRKSDEELTALAKRSLQQSKVSTAIVELKAALQANPKSGEARFLLGRAYMDDGNAALAAVEFEKSLELKYPQEQVVPRLAAAMLMLGQAERVVSRFGGLSLAAPPADAELRASIAQAYFSLGKLDDVRREVQAALHRDPSQVNALVLRARMVAGTGDFDEAIRQTQDLLAAHPRSAAGWQLKGDLAWITKSDAAGAEQAYREALIADPRWLPAHAALIALALEKQDIEALKTRVASLSAAVPTRPETRFYQTQLALAQNDMKRAREGVQLLLQAAPDNPAVLQLAGAMELKAGALLAAEGHLTKALNLAPSSANVRRTLVQTHLRAGQPAKALVALQPLLADSRAGAIDFSLAAEAHLQAGDPAKSELWYERASKSRPDDARIKTGQAMSMIAGGRVVEGLGRLEGVAAADSGTQADLALISARMRRKEFDQALQAITRLQAKIPAHPLPHLLRGRILLGRKNLAEARASFDQANKLDPAYFAAVAELAQLDVLEKRPDDAAKRFEALLTHDPKNARAVLAIADLRARAGATPDEIGTLFAKAVKLNPADVDARLLLIEHLISRHQAKAAVTAAQEGLVASPNEVGLIDGLGRAHMAAGDLQQALSAFTKAAGLAPNAPRPLLRLADVYMARKDLPAARKQLGKVLELEPGSLEAQRRLVKIAMAERRSDEAVKVARALQRSRPSDPEGYLLEADIHIGLRAWDSAVSAARAALERRKQTAIAVKLHSILLSAGKATDAERFATGWVRDQPKDVDFLSHLGRVAIDDQAYPQAEGLYRKVLAVRPDDIVALNNLAWLMVRQAKPGAVQLARRADELRPGEPWIMDTLANALAAEQQPKPALEVQRQVVLKAPEIPAYRLTLAKLLIQNGDRAAARTELDTLSKLGQRFPGHQEVADLRKRL